MWFDSEGTLSLYACTEGVARVDVIYKIILFGTGS